MGFPPTPRKPPGVREGRGRWPWPPGWGLPVGSLEVKRLYPSSKWPCAHLLKEFLADLVPLVCAPSVLSALVGWWPHLAPGMEAH